QAHRQGVVHRDLKPGNVMLTKSGAKLLDFGLAKIREVTQAVEDGDTRLLTRDLTAQGTILGTLQYMAPEQLEGKDADARSDIFAFGAVVFEIITGRKAFSGTSQASLIAAILTAEPPPIADIQSVIPTALDRVIRTCLAKNPDDRWQSAGDLARELKWIAEPGMAIPSREARAGVATSRNSPIAAALAAAGILAALWLSWIHFRERVPEQQSIRFTIPTEARLASQVRISPDGTRLAFVGQNVEGKIVLWVRPLDSLHAQALPGTEGATYPFWSPDSRQIGYFVWPNKLMRTDSSGGQPQIIYDAKFGLGGDWNRDGTILFSPNGNANSVLYRVSAGGGVPVPATTPNASAPAGHAFPVFLPDGRHFLYLARRDVFGHGRSEASSIFATTLDSKESKLLVKTAYSAAFSAGSKSVPPYLLFVRDSALMGQEMDLTSLQLRGEPFRISDSVATDGVYNFGDFSVSENGILAFNSAVYQHELIWLDRAGTRLGSGTPVDRYAHPVLAADGRHAIFERTDPKTSGPSLWRLDTERGEVSLFASKGGLPVFLPDGSAVAFVCMLDDEPAICRKTSGGAGHEEILWAAGIAKYTMDFSPDGRFMSYTDSESQGLWILPLQGERRPYRFYPSASLQFHGLFSPDGKWIAYTSNETGEFEVYVQPFPATGEKWKVSAHGGGQARWRRDMKEMFYRTVDGKMMAVPVKTAPRFEPGVPRMLFQSSADPLFPNLGIPYAVTPDGQRFLVNVAIDESRASPITVITNWTAGLKR
ncbi:MAG TPA: protein kinase, partial [Bryobacteraceae bacterium]